MNQIIDVYTDGSCIGNPGPGGWGFVAVQEGKAVYEENGDEADTTNNRMEMLAVIRALEWLEGRSACIHSDSELTVNVFNRSWRGKANPDLVRLGCALLSNSDSQLVWIKEAPIHYGVPQLPRTAGAQPVQAC